MAVINERSPLCPEELAMSCSDINFKGRDLRVFNGRGAVGVWDKTVTGVQSVRFPPVCYDGYRFSLAFREADTGVLVQDLMADMCDYMERTGGPDGQGPHPLGTNWNDFVPHQKLGFDLSNWIYQVLVYRDGVWQPGSCHRTGHYHKRLKDKWVSVKLETEVTVSADCDEFFLEATFTNRTDRTLTLTVIPVQNIIDHFKLNAYAPVERQGFAAMTHEASDGTKTSFCVGSDCEETSKEGFILCLPANEAQTVRFCVRFGKDIETPLYDPLIGERIERAKAQKRRRLAEISSALPSLKTENKLLDAYYKRCILTVLESTWRRDDYVLNPFYSCGTWMSTLAWDTSFSAKLLAMTEPEGLKKALWAYIGSDVLHSSYIEYRGNNPPGHAYIQTLFAAVKILEDYMAVTSDREILRADVNGKSALIRLVQAYDELFDMYLSSDGLLDLGPVSNQVLETRTDGYQHKISGVNGIAACYLNTVAGWCAENGLAADADRLAVRANALGRAMSEKMWDEDAGWFACIYPDGSRQPVYSYHLFDFIGSPLLLEGQRDAMLSHIREGEFLGKYGMYSIAKTDELHYDYDDVDWGGGGQYIGMPNRIVETLYALGESEKAWDILSRCILWCEKYPYFPQEIYTEKLDNPPYEMPLEISGGGGAQAVIFGVFGIRPCDDGRLIIKPAENKELKNTHLQGLVFAGHSYDVLLGENTYSVSRDGAPAAEKPYGDACIF